MPELDDPNERRARTLLAEIDTAAAMMSLVKYTRDPQLVRRYKEVAILSYLAVLDLVAISNFLPREEDEMWDQLAPIRQWVEQERLMSGRS